LESLLKEVRLSAMVMKYAISDIAEKRKNVHLGGLHNQTLNGLAIRESQWIEPKTKRVQSDLFKP
jgi:hypothetical protein